MGETTNQIEAEIQDRRQSLGSNLQELEQKIKGVTDWKQHFRNNPMPLIGVALGGGVLLATIMGGGGSRGRRKLNGNGSEIHAATEFQKSKTMETWDNIKGALIGVAATQVKDFVSEMVPGFRDQMQQLENKIRHTSSLAQ